MNSIFGPIVSSSDLAFHQQMFEQVFLLETISHQSLDKSAVRQVWGAQDHSAQNVVLQTPGSDYGVQVVAFDPSSETTIRHRTRGLVPGAAKVIDFFVSDLEQSLARAREFGLVINDDIAEYDSPEGRVREAHSWVLDEVVCALISPPPSMEKKFSSGLHRPVSEPQSISGPTTELKASAEFFERVFGFKVIYEYQVNDSNFGDMIGSKEPVNIRAKNIGWNLQAPYIGMIDYGLSKPGDDTIAPVSPTQRGLLGVTVITDDLAGVVKQLAPDTLLAGPSSGVLNEPWQGAPSALIRAPNGMLLQVIEQ
ncbi:MAG: hypothetical protein AB8B96_04235 [Lysobacterales bacterium]